MTRPGRGLAALGLAVTFWGAGVAWAAGPWIRPGVPARSGGTGTDAATGGSDATGGGQGAGRDPTTTPSEGTRAQGSGAGSEPAPSGDDRGRASTALSLTGTRAFDMARAADDRAAEALEEGESALARITDQAGGERAPESLKPILAEAQAAHEALVGYRRQAQSSATETLQALARAGRLTTQARPDPIRRDALEQQALLSAHEAAVVAARARAEAERLRALVAEARAILAGAGGDPATGRGPGRAAAGRPVTAAPASPSAPAPSGRADGLEVPNLVGARLDGASRDLAAAGLRLGGSTGPRDGFVVKQAPEAGARVAAGTAVSVILSATAATSTPGAAP